MSHVLLDLLCHAMSSLCRRYCCVCQKKLTAVQVPKSITVQYPQTILNKQKQKTNFDNNKTG